ncbi:CD320 antigen [Spea bombifrons]|uniref:CD320 antigen n=1 Tax=Spea bombifrons TaxID=233779 RepID=UPI002348F144|nr:CD320 antigen [Spea bombifrons]
MERRFSLAFFSLPMLVLAWQAEGETAVSGKCLQNQFQCPDGKCIPVQWQCDGDNDCPDGEDEDACLREMVCSGFQCTDGRCLSLRWKCDGHADCADGSDEDPLMCRKCTCPEGTFQCHNRECIPSRLVCNGHDDCTDGSDEEACSPKQCSPEEFLCGLDCLSVNVLCDGKTDCSGGLDETKERCDLESKSHCSASEFSCDGKCVPLAWNCDGHTDCEDESDEENCGSIPFLLVFNSSTITKMDLNGERREDVPFISSVAAVSGVLNSSEIFLVDREKRVIFRSLEDTSNTSSTIIKDIGPATCICVDWIYKLVFWIDSSSKTICVATLDGSKQRILHKDNISLPGAMAVDPLTGYIFWSDMGDEPKIEKAAINGVDRIPLVTAHIRRPVALTLDLKHSSVYWVDSELNTISKIAMDGQDRKVVLYSTDFLAKPSGIALFQDKIYWSDLEHDAVYSMPKHQQANATKVTSVSQPFGLLIFDRELQPDGLNLCLEQGATCSFLCVPSPSQELSQAYNCLNSDSNYISCLPETVNTGDSVEKISFYTSSLVFILSVLFSASLIFCVILYNWNKTNCNLLNTRLFEASKKYLKPDLDRTTSSTYMLSDLKHEEEDV